MEGSEHGTGAGGGGGSGAVVLEACRDRSVGLIGPPSHACSQPTCHELAAGRQPASGSQGGRLCRPVGIHLCCAFMCICCKPTGAKNTLHWRGAPAAPRAGNIGGSLRPPTMDPQSAIPAFSTRALDAAPGRCDCASQLPLPSAARPPPATQSAAFHQPAAARPRAAVAPRAAGGSGGGGGKRTEPPEGPPCPACC